jgi:hypothetical protein
MLIWNNDTWNSIRIIIFKYTLICKLLSLIIYLKRTWIKVLKLMERWNEYSKHALISVTSCPSKGNIASDKVNIKINCAIMYFNFMIYSIWTINTSHGPRAILSICIGINLLSSLWQYFYILCRHFISSLTIVGQSPLFQTFFWNT